MKFKLFFKKNLFIFSQLLLLSAPMLVSTESMFFWGEPIIPDCLKSIQKD